MAKSTPLPSPVGRLIGYARVSTDEQATAPQVDELRAAGCNVIIQERGSGASRARPELINLLRAIAAGETLVVVRIDRLARSVKHLLDVIEDLNERGAHFRSLRDPIDTSTPQGMFSLQVLGAVAQLERSLISERTKAGIEAARKRGHLPGNPGLISGNKAAIRKLTQGRDRRRTEALIDTAEAWLPVVRRLRPEMPWNEVASVLRGRGQDWSRERLVRASRRMVLEGLLPKEVMRKAPPRPAQDRLMTIVAGIAIANPDLSLREIAAQLKRMNERTPRGASDWQASSVKMLVDRAVATGIMTAPVLG